MVIVQFAVWILDDCRCHSVIPQFTKVMNYFINYSLSLEFVGLVDITVSQSQDKLHLHSEHLSVVNGKLLAAHKALM